MWFNRCSSSLFWSFLYFWISLTSTQRIQHSYSWRVSHRFPAIQVYVHECSFFDCRITYIMHNWLRLLLQLSFLHLFQYLPSFLSALKVFLLFSCPKFSRFECFSVPLHPKTSNVNLWYTKDIQRVRSKN